MQFLQGKGRTEITGIFIKEILDQEWGEFYAMQTALINDYIYSQQKRRSTGRLLNNRQISVTGGGGQVSAEATLKHPDYERFLDIKKLNFMGRGYGDKDRLVRSKGKPIHNSPVFSKLNTIAYRINWELAGEVLDSDLPKDFNVNVKLAGPYRG
jgi:hypothetical protein